jgi:hypothetical protein
MAETYLYKTTTENDSRIHKVEIENNIPISWEIEYGNKVDIPRRLVKYYSANQYGYQVLKNGEIWAAHPLDFNDPFDCSIQMWDINSFPHKEAKRIIDEFVFFGKDSNLNLFETRKLLLELILRFIGIYCLNDKLNSDLFWGYYNNHLGFSIQCETEILNNHLGLCPFKVEYKHLKEDDKLSLIPTELINRKIFSKLLRWVTLKKQEWMHENEWRYVFMDIELGNKNRKRKIPMNSIQEIILGYKFFSKTSNEWIGKNSKNYIFNEDFESNYSYMILKFLYKNQKIPLKQVYLNEDFTFTDGIIHIKEINGNKVTIVRH